jgi:hypothetical protein
LRRLFHFEALQQRDSQKFWNVSVVTLEPWSDGTEIQYYAKQQNVEDQVLALKIKA